MAAIKWEYTLTFIFTIFSVILLLLIGAQIHYGESIRAQLLQEIENVGSAGFTLQDIPSSFVSEETLDEYSELVERPLFFNERKPIVLSDEESAKESEVEEKVIEDISFILIGIVNTTNNVYALFQDPHPKPDDNESNDSEKKFKRRKPGDEIHNGWVLKEVLTDHIIISSGKETKPLPLRKPRKHKAASKRRKKSKRTKRTNPFNRKNKK